MSSAVAKITVGLALVATTVSAAPLTRVARGVQNQVEYQKLGDGYCRTPAGAVGDYLKLDNYAYESQCRDKCSSISSCVGYEYQQGENVCEIHWATISKVYSHGSTVCYKKIVTQFCTKDIMQCSDGSSVSRDPNNNCEFESCPSPPTCTTDVQQCSDGSFVSRDPDNNCEFESCPEPKLDDGTACVLGTTCNACKNQAEFWLSKGSTGSWACGSEPKLDDGTACVSGTTCKLCKSGQAEFWVSKGSWACGSEPKLGDGTACNIGTTCNACTSGHARFWTSKGFIACGTEQLDDGEICISNNYNTCALCKNPATFWTSKGSVACGSEQCLKSDSYCIPGTTCNLCCLDDGYKFSWLKFFTVCN